MVQSCHTTLIDEPDFQNMQKNAYPIVLCFNGKDHFTPTKPSSESKFYSWKLNKELGPIVSASLLVIEELDKHKLAPAVLTAINQSEDTICQTLPVFSPTSLSSHLKAVAVHGTRQALCTGGLCFSQVESRFLLLMLSRHWTLPPHLQTHFPFQMQINLKHQRNHKLEGGGGPKKYICHICGVVKPRKPDLTGHLWFAHQQGDPIVCDRPPCTGQSFSTRASLKKHIESQHKKKWPYKCKDCLLCHQSKSLLY